ncbi:MAG TPA: hypothetical protein VK607_10510 [Kofleriaceae bacterium]|nr:hypothetical protein [Kofleriaceae bacterium]
MKTNEISKGQRLVLGTAGFLVTVQRVWDCGTVTVISDDGGACDCKAEHLSIPPAPVTSTCGRCSGSGELDGEYEYGTCEACGGSGEVLR